MSFNIKLQARIHTSFHRFMEISQIFYKKNIKYKYICFLENDFRKASSEENGTGQYPVQIPVTQKPR